MATERTMAFVTHMDSYWKKRRDKIVYSMGDIGHSLKWTTANRWNMAYLSSAPMVLSCCKFRDGTSLDGAEVTSSPHDLDELRRSIIRADPPGKIISQMLSHLPSGAHREM